jgi:hypothetical protein
MIRSLEKSVLPLLSLAVVGTQTMLPGEATTYQAGVTRARVKHTTYWQRHPKVKSAAIGAGVGTAAGAATGLLTGRGVGRGAVIGAGTGAGVGLIRSSHTMKRHPIVNDTATGAAVGLGLGLAGGRSHGFAGKATAVGAAVGLGIGMFKHLR